MGELLCVRCENVFVQEKDWPTQSAMISISRYFDGTYVKGSHICLMCFRQRGLELAEIILQGNREQLQQIKDSTILVKEDILHKAVLSKHFRGQSESGSQFVYCPKRSFVHWDTIMYQKGYCPICSKTFLPTISE